MTKHIQLLQDFQEPMELKPAHKLTSSHLQQNHFDKMKVGTAKGVICRDVSCGLKLASDDMEDDTILTTAWFIEIASKWFNIMTSRNHVLALSLCKPEKHDETITFLRDVIHIFKNLQFMGRGKNKNKPVWKPIQTGVILSTTSMIHIQDLFLKQKNYKFLMTGRFTQDCLENLFSLVRAKQPIPTALQFKDNLKLISVSQYLKCKANSSYDVDDRDNLLSVLTPEKKSQDTPVTITLPTDWDKNTDSSTLSNAEQNCLYRIAGYIVDRVEQNDNVCSSCIESFGSRQRCDASYAKLLFLQGIQTRLFVFLQPCSFWLFPGYGACVQASGTVFD